MTGEPGSSSSLSDTESTTTPRPDPTKLTTEQIERAIAAEHAFVLGEIKVLGERLEGMDTATELRVKDINRIPGIIDEKVNHLGEVVHGRFDSIALQFKERDTRQERESRDNKVAVDAAFAAQKEAASEQNKSNTLAITKSETATAETIQKLSELSATTNRALSDKIDDLKERVSQCERTSNGMAQNKAGGNAAWVFMVAAIGLAATIIATVLAITSAVGK